MSNQSIEEYLLSEFGFDQYKASNCADNHRVEIMNSDICGCFMCYENFVPSEIRYWTDSEQTACCPKCGMGNVVVGSASGMPVNDKNFLKLVRAHWS